MLEWDMENGQNKTRSGRTNDQPREQTSGSLAPLARTFMVGLVVGGLAVAAIMN